MPEKLSTEMLKASQSFFDISEEEKREYAGRDVFSPVRCGIGFNASMDKGLHWRDYLRAFVHPDFHIPNKPSGFRQVYVHFINK